MAQVIKHRDGLERVIPLIYKLSLGSIGYNSPIQILKLEEFLLDPVRMRMKFNARKWGCGRLLTESSDNTAVHF